MPSDVASRVCRLCEDINFPIIPNKVILYGGEGQYCGYAEYFHNFQDNIFDSCSAFQEAHSSECCIASSLSPSIVASTSPTTSLSPTAGPSLTPSATSVVRAMSGGKPQTRFNKGLATFVILGSLVALLL
uniref:Uncharacterized protein n=1 Tax=Attheya septentrionalis TaxID=420275 RepID=A0A7S2XPS7_9STRA